VVLDDGIYKEVNISIPKPDNRNWKPIYFLYTLYRAQVTESYYGNLVEGDIIYVGQIGGKMGNRHYITNAMIPMMYADDLILFLTTHEEIEQADLITPWSAVYHIETENDTRISSDTRASDDHKLVPVDERGRLSFTIGELRNYRAKEE
ncbi:MAG: hypothetical protein LBC96_00005, partial [Lachnospiraceae bacterium]|nr:hypothetical protein [Lachnospiraceae bacterium]